MGNKRATSASLVLLIPGGGVHLAVNFSFAIAFAPFGARLIAWPDARAGFALRLGTHFVRNVARAARLRLRPAAAGAPGAKAIFVLQHKRPRPKARPPPPFSSRKVCVLDDPFTAGVVALIGEGGICKQRL